MEREARPQITTLRERWQAEHFPDSLAQTRVATESNDGKATELSELNAPQARVENPTTSSLEDPASSAEPQSRPWLTELEAPSPATNESRGSFLDDGEGRKTSNEGFARQPESSGPVQNGFREAEGQKLKTSESPVRKVEYSPFLTELYTVSWLIFFSFWGTLARVGVEALTLYPNSPFASRVLWANLGGSFVIGFLTEDRRLFQEEWGTPNPGAGHAAHVKVKKSIPLYIGLATGFCGCFTSFSSFMRDAFLALTNALESPNPTTPYQVDPTVHSRNGGFSFLALLAVLVVEPAVSIGALKAGAHFALLLQPVTPVISHRLSRKLLEPVATVLAFGCWLGAIFLTIWPPGNKTHWRYRATFPLVFSPPGCLLRYYLSKHLNGRIPAFPLGTFVANILGTIVLGMAWDLQHATGIGAVPGATAVGCSALQGLMEGFCGCLTTVSTWVLELDSLRRRHAWIYGLASTAVGLASMIIIMGSMGWTIGFATPFCS
ncbi:uncharacterized protein HMPREF1541_03793 [Cyphellophora europaea CBS 101466]|uniref:Fluoride export protein 1 n=1 Tax=Cyphellophora europaea (strain CBS 101466) TaxID=1220924 RepID=W2S1L9_CYPE1|nr:uncharacterized protein HMPREF1541_03793 [Cyphellophora europaea CBS 101466]ETN41854.1 hypothetical protein HMPREF1541_03793 [Cyphellophora europaea CBS 101466]